MQMSVIDLTLKQIDGRWQIHQQSSTRGTQQAKQESTHLYIQQTNRSPAATELLLPLIRMTTTPNKIPSGYKFHSEKCITIFYNIKGANTRYKVS